MLVNQGQAFVIRRIHAGAYFQAICNFRNTGIVKRLHGAHCGEHCLNTVFAYFADGKTTVTRPLTIGFRSSGPPHVSGSAAHDPGFIRV
jgi:hypothetical protein